MRCRIGSASAPEVHRFKALEHTTAKDPRVDFDTGVATQDVAFNFLQR